MKNHLFNSLSPYLQDHANDPVHWYPWGNDALDRAKKENKPIFLSIGYASCHWCHVMARESFQDEQVAELLNQNFICIKVDREERPDIDDIYMEALIGLSGHGGWPMSLFLTPNQLPFFAGTYFPKLPQQGHMAFVELIGRIVTLWHRHRGDVDNIANEIKANLNHEVTLNQTTVKIDQWLNEVDNFIDYKLGGLEGAPKFPQIPFWQGVLVGATLQQKTNMIDACYLTASSLLMGGIYDHLDGGMSRYTVDDQWHMPHFEKMLSDNALLLHFLVDLYGYRSHDWFKDKAYHVKSWLSNHLLIAADVYLSSMDAEALGQEGLPYLWSWENLVAILGEDLEEAKRYFNWQKPDNIHQPCMVLDTIHLEEKVFDDSVIERIIHALKIARQEMPQPRVDDKVLLDWNMALIAAMAKASVIFKDNDWLAVAKKAYKGCSNLLYHDNQWHHVANNDQLGEKLFLDDLANVMYAQIQIYAACKEQVFLDQAEETYKLLESYWNHDANLYHMDQYQNNDLIKNPMPIIDNATPSGNALMATNLALLGLLTGNNDYVSRCEALLEIGLSQASPETMGQWVVAEQYLTNGKVIKGNWIERPKALVIKPNWLLVLDSTIEGIEYCDFKGCHQDKTSMTDLIDKT
ncbi:MAG: thioredoxin domain-containing protein [Pseudomonadota bacterium]|nr:thioredoxin domain-containing protein [Pseudomonadota bacterium]